MNKKREPLKTVWVLGAGFSRAVGGPLLTQLLSASSAHDLGVRFTDQPDLAGDLAQTVRVLFRSGLRGPDGGVGRPSHNLWGDAEEFIEYLDTASEDPKGPLGVRLLGLVLANRGPLPRDDSPSVGNLRAMARRLIAAECSAFLVGANTTAERWDPYHAWSRGLRYDDTIITFNYDRVIENLDGSHLKAGPPGTDWETHKARDLCRVLKLHGSVDWIRLRDGTAFEEAPAADFAVSARDECIAIATPGPTKRSAAKELSELWDLACSALREADVIVFVGYRFPPSDAEARAKLLGAIRENRARSKHLRVNIVLGPERTSDVIRLEQMVRAVLRSEARLEVSRAYGPKQGWGGTQIGSFDVTPHAMWAEDFFTVWSRDLLQELPQIESPAKFKPPQ